MEDTVVSLATEADAEALWHIRYHPSVVLQSLDQTVVRLDSHKDWFRVQYASGHDHRCFILRYKGRAIGYCRFDKKGEFFLVSIAIHPDYQGEGRGSFLLREGLQQMEKGSAIRAAIKKHNVASHTLFLRHGFVVVETDGEIDILTKQSV